MVQSVTSRDWEHYPGGMFIPALRVRLEILTLTQCVFPTVVSGASWVIGGFSMVRTGFSCNATVSMGNRKEEDLLTYYPVQRS